MPISVSFVANNIEYRIVSSKCLEKYKSSQSFMLKEISASSVYEFHESSRNLMLLMYDEFFRWTLDLERFLLTTPVVYDKHLNKIHASLEQNIERCAGIISKNSRHFNKKSVKMVKEINSFVLDYFKKKLTAFKGYSRVDFFVHTTDTVLKLMSSNLFMVHEVDFLVHQYNGKDGVFVSYDDMCIEFVENTGQCLIAYKLDVYKNNIKNFPKSVTVKNYTDKMELPDRLLKEVSALGITISNVV